MARAGDDPGGRVAITGIGLATSLGLDRESTWRNLLLGRSGARWLGPDHGLADFAGFPLPEPGPSIGRASLAFEILDRLVAEALDHAGLDLGSVDRHRAGVLVGMSKGNVEGLSLTHEDHGGPHRAGRGARRVPWTIDWPDGGAAHVAGSLGWSGPTSAPIAACASGLIAALQGADLIRAGRCDLALVGNVDVSLHPLVLHAFRRMKVLARVDDSPASAVRPLSKGRSGFLVGEGGAILVLERLDHAHARGTRVIAELAGGAIGSDAYHETSLCPDPVHLARVIGKALGRSGISPEEVDAANLHGTATLGNDPLECRAIGQVFGRSAGRISCSASKAQFGHLLGAAGSAELAIAALSVDRQVTPPTINLDDPDPDCRVDGTPHRPVDRPIRHLLKLSLGFGGHLVAAVLSRPIRG